MLHLLPSRHLLSLPGPAGYISFYPSAKCILNVMNARPCRNKTRGRIDLDHIKTRLQLARMLLQIHRGCRNDTLLFRGRHKFTCFTIALAFSRFNLNKGKNFAASRNQIDLTKAATIVCFNNAPAAQTQISSGLCFTPRAGTVIAHSCFFLKKLGRCTGDGPYSRSAA